MSCQQIIQYLTQKQKQKEKEEGKMKWQFDKRNFIEILSYFVLMSRTNFGFKI